MIAFLIGCAISLVAALPVMLLMRKKYQASFGGWLKMWVMRVVVRFGIIGVSLYALFTRTDVDRVPVLLGILAVYFLIFFIQSLKTFRT